MTASERQIFERQGAILEALSSLAVAVTSGAPPMRYLSLEEAARYCRFAGDAKCRAFLRFVREERIPYKQGNTAAAKIFDVVELNRAMGSRLKTLD